jgi:hypothetical protein
MSAAKQRHKSRDAQKETVVVIFIGLDPAGCGDDETISQALEAPRRPRLPET